MSLIYQNGSIIPLEIKLTFWQFMHEDISVNGFEKWVYTEKRLQFILKEEFYIKLLSTNYEYKLEVNDLRADIFQGLKQEPQSCLCFTFSNYTLLNPFISEPKMTILNNYVKLLAIICSFENFSKSSPLHQSRWYHPAKLCRCVKCGQFYLSIFEESELCVFYIIRLAKKETDVLQQNPIWPNEKWPDNFKNWDKFDKINFKVWDNHYLKLLQFV